MSSQFHSKELEVHRENLRILYDIAEELSEQATPDDRRRRVVQLVSSIFKTDALLVSGHIDPESQVFHGLITYCQGRSQPKELPYPYEGIEDIAPHYSQELVERWLRGDLDDTMRIRAGRTVAYPMERHGRKLGLFMAPVLSKEQLRDKQTRTIDPDVVNALRKHCSVALELSALQRDLLQQERFAAIGATVAGLAHCLKNTLNGLKGGVYVVERSVENDDKERIHQGWRVLKNGVRHIERLTSDMLLYATERKITKEPIEPNAIMEEVLELLKDTAQHQGIELVSDLSQGIGEVQADRHMLYRAVQNLAANAIDACVESEHGDKVAFRSRLKRKSLVLTIKDNGVGIPSKILQRVSERFFTTKASKGTGLGLPVVEKIAKLHDGSLEIESELGKGSSFHIIIPV